MNFEKKMKKKKRCVLLFSIIPKKKKTGKIYPKIFCRQKRGSNDKGKQKETL